MPAWGLQTPAPRTARVQASPATSSSAARERRWRRCSRGPRRVAAAAYHSTFGLKACNNILLGACASHCTCSTSTYQSDTCAAPCSKDAVTFRGLRPWVVSRCMFGRITARHAPRPRSERLSRGKGLFLSPACAGPARVAGAALAARAARWRRAGGCLPHRASWLRMAIRARWLVRPHERVCSFEMTSWSQS